MKSCVKLVVILGSLTFNCLGAWAASCQGPLGGGRSLAEKINVNNLLVVTAMEVEEAALLTGQNPTTHITSPRLGQHYKHFQVGERSVNVINSGVGGVNAGIALSFFLHEQVPDAVIMLGVGGALDSRVNIGDLVIADKVVQHDSFFSGELGNEFMAPGELFLSLEPHARVSPIIIANPSLVDWLRRNFESSNTGSKIFVGKVLSGAEFVGTPLRKKQLAEAHGALLVDMESAAIAQICRRQGIPFVIAKTAADRLNPDDTVSSDYRLFLSNAAQRAAELLHLLFETP